MEKANPKTHRKPGPGRACGGRLFLQKWWSLILPTNTEINQSWKCSSTQVFPCL